MARPLAILLAVATLVAGCRDGGAADAGADFRVVATTAHLADFARAVGGDRAAVGTLVGADVDPHDYEPRPSDARAVAEADVVLQSGGFDAWLGDVVEGAGGDAARVTLLDAVPVVRDGAGGERDPHWWQDPRNVVRAVDRIREAFTAAHPAGAETYAANARAYVRRIKRLDAAIARCMDGIPAERRKLVTGHDAFGYFAARYDIEILGSILPALSTTAQPSAGDLRELVAAIRREDVRTVFPESALQHRLEEAVARDAGAEVGPPLYADTLGPAGSPGATYLGALRHDAAALAGGFGGRCAL